MTKPALLLLFALTAGTAPAATPKADILWQKGDYRTAFAQAIEPALGGDAHAQFLIGEAYRLGRSVDANAPLAEDWYMRAARQGNVAAAAELGLLYTGQRRYAEALPWLSLAARHGEPRALCSLAALYFNGEGIAQDGSLAFALMSRAAAAGLPEATARLAILRTALAPEVQAKGVALAAGPWARALRLPVAVAPVRFSPTPAIVRTAAPTFAATTTSVRFQIGAYHSADAAEQAWVKLRRQVDGLRGPDHIVVPAGEVYRLQIRLADADKARTVSRKLTASGWDHLELKSAPAT